MTQQNNKKTVKMTDKQRAEWVDEQVKKGVKFLAENGIVMDYIDDEHSRVVAPYFVICKLKTIDKHWVWVISGDLPTDYKDESAAGTAREALRHFALSWQLQAENILRSGTQDVTQQQYAAILSNRAEKMFEIFELDTVW